MVDLREKYRELKVYIESMPPLVAAFVIMIIVTIPLDILSVYWGWVNKAELEALRNLIRQSSLKEIAFSTLVYAPLLEEFMYRGPVRLLVLFFPNVTTKNLIAWLIILAPTFYWAMIAGGGGHGIPLDALAIGIICGWAVVETKTLESAIALHIFYNALNLVGVLIRYRFLSL
ncbi:MAG: CPBP family intramembrane metalloprotease [Candidatus Harrisonbacteria bacterium]|nr:CPBP family intramembrane metalloprotease [Candidatus Harrisonbacteria bacterium]